MTVLFYGDHLPSFAAKYEENLSELEKYSTDFYIYSNHGRNKVINLELASPIFFANVVASQDKAKLSAYYAVLEELFTHVQTFNNEHYYVNGKAMTYGELDGKTKDILHDYRLVQYDLTSGKSYLSKKFFDYVDK